MNFFTVSLWLYSVALPVLGNHIEEANSVYPMKTDEGSAFKKLLLEDTVSRQKRNAFVIPECVFVTSKENTYIHKATSDSESQCGFYIFTDYKKVIEISLEHLHAPCNKHDFVTFVDGWELDGHYFPGVTEHEKPLEDRLQKFCGKKVPEDRRLVSSQNAAMLLYPGKTASFTLRVKFLENKIRPCNILVDKEKETYTLETYSDGKAKNCSLIALYPTSVIVYHLHFEQHNTGNIKNEEIGTMEYCERNDLTDYILIGNSKTLEPNHIVPHFEFCGIDPQPDPRSRVFGCGVVIVKLVASGQYYNKVTFRISHASEMEVEDSFFKCRL